MSLLRQFQPNLAVMSPQALAFQKEIARLPDPNEDPKAYRTALQSLNEKFADFLRLQTQVQLVELSQQDPDEYMRVMPKILDNFIPKMKSVESKVEAVIDNRVYVETAYREPVPIDALKRAGVVIESESGTAAEEKAPGAQSPAGSGHSHPASPSPPSRLPSPSPAARSALQSVIAAPGSALARLLTDEEVLS